MALANKQEGEPQHDQTSEQYFGLSDHALNYAFRNENLPQVPSLRRQAVQLGTKGLIGISHFVLQPPAEIARELRTNTEGSRALIEVSVHDAVVEATKTPEQQKRDFIKAVGGTRVADIAYGLISPTHDIDAAFDALQIARAVINGENYGGKRPRRLLFDALVTAIDKSPVPTPFFNLHFISPIANKHELRVRIDTLDYLANSYLTQPENAINPQLVALIRQSFKINGTDYLPQLSSELPDRIAISAQRIEELAALEAPLLAKLKELHGRKLTALNEYNFLGRKGIKNQIQEVEAEWNLLRREYTYLLGVHLQMVGLNGIISHIK